jgi:hypothetical protein
MHDVDESLWPVLPHVDFFQPGSDGMVMNVRYQVYESNLMGDNPYYHSHIFQMRDTTNTGDHDVIIRGNVGYNVGSYVQQAGGIDNVSHYNNAYYKIPSDPDHINMRGAILDFNTERVDNPSIGNYLFNNIIYDTAGNYPFNIDGTSAGTGSQVDISHNLCYLALAQSGCFAADPMFVNAYEKDFHLQPDSPAKDAGKAITTVTSSSGSGVSFNVAEAKLFTDGFGIADGDMIKVGANGPVRVTSISGNTITVNRSISWNNGDGVYWRNQDTSPDIGAYEYKASGYDYGISISSPSNNQQVSGLVTVTTTPLKPENIRFVSFYIDNIPVLNDFDAPYTYSWDSSGLTQGSSHTIEVRAYPLYATSDIVKSHKISVTAGALVCPSLDMPGDLNRDGIVDSADFFIIVSDFGKTSGFNNAFSDHECNSIVDIYDIVYVASRMS